MGSTAMVLENSWRPPTPLALLLIWRSICATNWECWKGASASLKQHQGIWMPPTFQEHIAGIAPECQHVSHRMAASVSHLKARRQCLCVPKELHQPLTHRPSQCWGTDLLSGSQTPLQALTEEIIHKQPQPGNISMQEWYYLHKYLLLIWCHVILCSIFSVLFVGLCKKTTETYQLLAFITNSFKRIMEPLLGQFLAH